MKKGEVSGGMAILLIIVAIVAVMGWQNGTIPGWLETSDSNGGVEIPTECGSDSSITMKIGPVEKAYSPTTAMTGFGNVWFKDAGTGYIYQGNDTSGTSKTVRCGERVKVYYGVDTAYFASEGNDIVVPYGPFATADFDGDKVSLFDEGTVTMKFFNGDTGNDNIGGELSPDNETIGASESGTWDVSIEVPVEDAMSPYGQVFLVIDYDKNNYTASDWALGGWSKGNVPNLHSSAGTTYSTVTFIHDGCKPGQGQVCDLTGQLQATAKADGADWWFNVSVYYEDIDRDPDFSNVMVYGVENSDSTLLASDIAGSERVWVT